MIRPFRGLLISCRFMRFDTFPTQVTIMAATNSEHGFSTFYSLQSSFIPVTLEREGVDEGAGQNAMFSVFVSLSPFVFDTQSGRSLAHLKTHLGRVTSKYFPSAAESDSRKINLWQAGCCVAYW